MATFSLNKFPIHLGLGASAVTQPEFTGEMQWYEGYGQRHSNDGTEGRLVSMHTFTESWDVWEMHPRGTEVVLCTSGSITMHQEYPDGTTKVATINAGEYVVNDPGVWHTADVTAGATAVFITAGEGTEHRSR
jgi:mannose-6-phosphate isomerase-like protein (cupin superfamily)